MDHFHYTDGELHCDEVPARQLAEEFGTPLYVYCARTIRHHFQVLKDAFAELSSPPLICYSVKANSNLSILRLLGEMGSGYDIVSGGELDRIAQIDGPMDRVVFAGVGKTDAEIEHALRHEIKLFNVEAESELERIERCASKLGVKASVALRLNPDVDPKTHRYITTGKRENKFGVDLDRARRVIEAATRMESIECEGLHVHLGSQITETRPYVEGLTKVLAFIDEIAEVTKIRYLDIGGGFGVHYRPGEALPAEEFASAIVPLFEGRDIQVILEPGRFIMGNAGALLTRIITLKGSGERSFAICDAGMNDLLRPALYQAYHRIWPVRGEAPGDDDSGTVDVVGPICESGDFLGRDRALPDVEEGDLLSVFSAGAYCMAMSGNYNTRPRAAEVLVDGSEVRLIRRRESLQDLLATELELG